MATVTHPACGKSWTQRGNRTGHCAKCHETFEGITAFDWHQMIQPDGSVVCRDLTDPTVNRDKNGDLLYKLSDNGSWMSAKELPRFWE